MSQKRQPVLFTACLAILLGWPRPAVAGYLLPSASFDLGGGVSVDRGSVSAQAGFAASFAAGIGLTGPHVLGISIDVGAPGEDVALSAAYSLLGGAEQAFLVPYARAALGYVVASDHGVFAALRAGFLPIGGLSVRTTMKVQPHIWTIMLAYDYSLYFM